MSHTYGGDADRERTFHDALALTLDPTELPPPEPVIYDTALLQAAGIGAHSRVLDLGCGQGDLTLALLARGATVTSLDISPGMVDIARRRVELSATAGEHSSSSRHSRGRAYRQRAATL